MTENNWYGYVHVNGSFHVKRYFSSLDIKEAISSVFVDIVRGPFLAKNREDALKELHNLIGEGISNSLDISMCQNESCSINLNCFRYTATAKPVWQSYTNFQPEPDGSCEYFKPNK